MQPITYQSDIIEFYITASQQQMWELDCFIDVSYELQCWKHMRTRNKKHASGSTVSVSLITFKSVIIYTMK